VTLSDESEEEAPESEKFLAFVALHVEEEDSYYSEHRENEEELKEDYKTLYKEFEKLREGRKQHLNDLNSLQTEKCSFMLKVQDLEEKLLKTQLQLERVTDEMLTRMLSIQKSPNDKTGLEYVASSSDVPSSLKTVFMKPTVPDLPPAVEDKRKEKVNDDVPGTQQPHSIRRPPICHHRGLSGHVRSQCSLLKAQKAKAKKEAPRQAHYGARPVAQHQTPWHQASYQVPWGQTSRHQYQAPWSHTPQHQRPQQRFVPANHSGTYKSKPKQVRRPQKMQYSSEPPIWMQNMME
jgi:ssDNA-specific exonuclease RecJ